MRTFELKISDEARENLRKAADDALSLVACEVLENLEAGEVIRQLDLTFRLYHDEAGDFQVKVLIDCKSLRSDEIATGVGGND